MSARRDGHAAVLARSGLALGVLAATALTAAALAARLGYPWELASHFRPHLTVGAGGLALAALVVNARRTALAAATLAALNGAFVATAGAGLAPKPPATAPTATLFWANVAMSPAAFREAARLARAVDADIIALTEVPRAVTPGLASALDVQCVDMPGPESRLRVVLATRSPCRAQAIATPDPFADAAWPHALRALSPRLRATAEAAVGAPYIVALHPPPPLSPGRRAVRDAIIAHGAEEAARAEAAVLVGDFNATPWSPARADLARFGLRAVDCGAPWRSTWFTRAPWGLPIDAAYVRGPVQARCRVGPDIGSDHFPLIIALSTTTPPDAPLMATAGETHSPAGVDTAADGAPDRASVGLRGAARLADGPA